MTQRQARTYINESLDVAIDAEAARLGVTRSDVVRMALELLLTGAPSAPPRETTEGHEKGCTCSMCYWGPQALPYGSSSDRLAATRAAGHLDETSEEEDRRYQRTLRWKPAICQRCQHNASFGCTCKQGPDLPRPLASIPNPMQEPEPLRERIRKLRETLDRAEKVREQKQEQHTE